MDAVLVRREKNRLAGGLILEIVIWQVPEPIAGSGHLFKYRLFFGRAGERLIGYDNERGKGDHRHTGGTEDAYEFRGVAPLIDDFLRDVEEWRAQQ